VRAGLILLVFMVAVSAIVVWSREQLRLSDGQIMADTRVKRLEYQVLDSVATENKRQEARESAAKVYRLNESYLSRIEASLLGLPQAVAGKTELDEIDDELRDQFALTTEGLAALQDFADEGEPTGRWRAHVRCLIDDQLRRHPIIDSAQYQLYITTLKRVLELPDGTIVPLKGDAIELRDSGDDMSQRLRDLVVNRCEFPLAVAPYVLARLLQDPKPTMSFDEEATDREAEAAAAGVQPVSIPHKAGEVLYRRGDMLDTPQRLEVEREAEHFWQQAGVSERWIPRAGLIGLSSMLLVFLGLFAAMSYPLLLRNWLRVVTLCTLLTGLLLLTATITVRGPLFIYVITISCSLFAAVVVRLAYDQRLALVVASVHCALMALALQQGLGWFILLLAGCATFIGQLREIRNRNSMIRAASVAAVVLSGGAVILGLVELPVVPGSWQQIISNAGWAAAASFGVGFLVLGILPSIEKLFDITTGMTLAELRDPKQPLLRQLQQRAPGTYNHSLQVANICEAAADAIGADGLLLYVGALYHDVGKMNKPDYFIENQTDGYNRHEKLSPAMSLLVIIGHVKDGIELAREYNLPRSLIHFIESHHGTTLVEYFFHAARTQAEADEKSSVDEVVFRYPGPKPRTREAAILMLADAVESATRAMADPTPSRIESLVRDLSRKRLTDGQFDQCPLTFRELGLIEDAIISRVCAIHHGRISYPSSKPAEPPAEAAPAKTVSA
jgi:putative nucleotidyltransferase with HDIG domain